MKKPRKTKFKKKHLRAWEFCLTQGFPLPNIPVDDLIELWKKHGFGANAFEVISIQFRKWEKTHPQR